MATGDIKRAVMTDDIDNAQSSYPVMSLRTVDAAPDAAHTNNLITSAAVAAKASSLAAGMAIIATGNTHAAITKGQYVYIQDHATLAEGMYEATANIAANGTLSTSNVTAKSEGAANALKAALDAVSVNAAKLRQYSINPQKSYKITLSSYYCVAFLFAAVTNTATLDIIFANGYARINAASTAFTATFNNDGGYKDFTIINSTSNYTRIGILIPENIGITFEEIT